MQEFLKSIDNQSVNGIVPKISYKIANDILDILLIDRTTGKNILWATNNYISQGSEYSEKQMIKVYQITGNHSRLVRPRVKKSKQEQSHRTKNMAETFTPSWICNKQNNLIDDEWFGRKNSFNFENEIIWVTNQNKIEFPTEKGKTWQDYIKAIRLEITCGEAPYIVSRYDTTTGVYIPINDRIGLLDRKLRVISENTDNKEEWFFWCQEAFKSIYGFEFQGDNLLLARKNLLLTFIEYYYNLFGKYPDEKLVKDIAIIISWNIWQMDGLKFVIPYSCHSEIHVEQDLFGENIIKEECMGCKKGIVTAHNGIYCKIKDWEKGKTIKAVSLLRG